MIPHASRLRFALAALGRWWRWRRFEAVLLCHYRRRGWPAPTPALAALGGTHFDMSPRHLWPSLAGVLFAGRNIHARFADGDTAELPRLSRAWNRSLAAHEAHNSPPGRGRSNRRRSSS